MANKMSPQSPSRRFKAMDSIMELPQDKQNTQPLSNYLKPLVKLQPVNSELIQKRALKAFKSKITELDLANEVHHKMPNTTVENGATADVQSKTDGGPQHEEHVKMVFTEKREQIICGCEEYACCDCTPTKEGSTCLENCRESCNCEGDQFWEKY